jgi:hypothetical protein
MGDLVTLTGRAQQLIDLHWSGHLPVKPDEIAARLGVAVRRCDPVEGRSVILRSAGGSVEILVADSAPAVRQRFAVAHALGHLVAGDLRGARQEIACRTPDFSSAAIGSERRANSLALELMMPARILEFVITRQAILDDGDLAARFGVCAAALRCRLRVLGLAG